MKQFDKEANHSVSLLIKQSFEIEGLVPKICTNWQGQQGYNKPHCLILHLNRI